MGYPVSAGYGDENENGTSTEYHTRHLPRSFGEVYLLTIHNSLLTSLNFFMKGWLLTIGLIFLIAIEVLRVYFIMPFPGSQQSNTISIAYFIDRNIWWLRVIGFIIVIIPLIYFLRNGRIWKKMVLVLVLLFYGEITYAFNCKFLAEKMFYQPKGKSFATAQTDTTAKSKLVIGVHKKI